MCGIAGIARFDRKPVQTDELRYGMKLLSHRGPDGEGLHVDGAVALGHRRLAIIDPAGGKQPFVDEPRGLALTYNGEVYNYPEIRQALGDVPFRTASDTEVVLRAYARWGIDCLAQFRGMFAFALLDRAAEKLFLVRDRLGIKPLYYHANPNRLVFASELGALLAWSDVSRVPDQDAVANYLRLGYVPTPGTIFAGVRKLAPGSYLEVSLSSGMVREQRYWTLAPEPRPRSAPEALAELDALLRETVRLYVRSDVPFGAFLSGGVDSSVVTALMSETLDQPVRTYTIDFAEASHSEARFAAEAARVVGSNHTSTTVSPDMSLAVLSRLAIRFGEPFADSSAIPSWYVAGLATRDVKMVLSGDGGDELFAGYNSYPDVYRAAHNEGRRRGWRGRLGAVVGRGAAGCGWQEAQRRQRETFDAPMRARLLGRAVVTDSEASGFEPGSALDPVTRCQLHDTRTYLLDDVLTKVDRMSMDHSLEVRVPLLDHKLVEFAFDIPTALKIAPLGGGDVTTKWLLKEWAAKIYPRDLVDRRKWGFGIPVNDWVNGPLRSLIEDMLDSGAERFAPLLDPAAVRGVARDYYSGRARNVSEVWNLLSLGLWMEEIGRAA